ncbi:V-type ATP synthase subunit I [Pseudoflavonifractor phocaeensis]|uniref:V-type ATP synthase subunit I n=1 Tax=Pseudoflavonifractor phocaeensis TaxID=1870988 RepID=UPI00195E5A05|nr:V-type ATPase 116kDa subunit family protein [Pseudoflavonifractor phocaeensis]MBM6938010.1 V-type ATP synthase subunit I [Pseudoflavonifractor phocaeensis]
MAIVKMKRLRLIGMAAERDELLRQLQRVGCVEIDEPEDQGSDPDWNGLARVSDTALAEREAENASLQSALTVLDRYPKEKEGAFQPKPRVTEQQLFDGQVRAEARKAASAISAGEKHLAQLQSEMARKKSQLQSLTPWKELDLPLETAGTRDMAVLFLSFPANTDLEQVSKALEEATELSELQAAGADREFQYAVLFCHRSGLEDGLNALKPFGFARVALRGWTGTAADNIRRLEGELDQLAREGQEEEKNLAGQTGHREALRLAIDQTEQERRREICKSRLMASGSAVFLEGWLPADQEKALEEALEPFTCAWETQEPAEEDYPKVPILLKNNPLTAPLNMITNMYVLPAYDGVDPNPLMAPFFIFFFGMMMADMGYGILMVILSLVMTRKMHVKGTMKDMAGLLMLCGISTFIMGAVTGGFFGDFIPQLAKLINPNTTLTALPALFTPLTDTLAILVGALALGLLQVVTGMAVSVVRKCQAGEAADAIGNEVAWWIILAGIPLAIFGIGTVAGVPVVLVVGFLVLIWGSTREAKGFGKITSLIGALYNGVTGFFSDILSYARLMALMLAGSVIATVFNTLGTVTGNVVAFILIAMVGNLLNFALNLLGCYVHDMRLQCLEYFGRFYKEGGKPFKPLLYDTKYVDIVKEEP